MAKMGPSPTISGLPDEFLNLYLNWVKKKVKIICVGAQKLTDNGFKVLSLYSNK